MMFLNNFIHLWVNAAGLKFDVADLLPYLKEWLERTAFATGSVEPAV